MHEGVDHGDQVLGLIQIHGHEAVRLAETEFLATGKKVANVFLIKHKV